MSRPFTVAALSAAALLALAGCGPSGPHGTVTDKEYEAAHTSRQTVPATKHVCTWTAKRSGTTTTRKRSCRDIAAGTRTVTHTRPECWELELDTGDEVCVSHHTWLTTDVGDKY
ncbi:hypothetical protein [Streptomyces sp. NPDC051016]|uniref:hypothetical protein n=1 Tax=Streptomyces sp. NPDC051016 TaxID=3365638 RepID=UPI003799C348